MGVPRFVYTDVAKDGMLAGPERRDAAARRRRDVGPRHRLGRASAASRTSGRWRRATTGSTPPSSARRCTADAFTLERGVGRRRRATSRRERPRSRPADPRRPGGPCHPVPRRHRRPGRQGRQLRRPAGRRRPGRARRVLRPRGRRRAVLPRHHRVQRRPRHHASTSSSGSPTRCRSRSRVGGGMRSVDDARRMLHAGADKISFNTAAVQRPELLAEAADAVGSQSVVAAVDARRRGSGDVRRRVATDPAAGWEVFVHGGRTADGAGRGRLVRRGGDRSGRARSC